MLLRLPLCSIYSDIFFKTLQTVLNISGLEIHVAIFDNGVLVLLFSESRANYSSKWKSGKLTPLKSHWDIQIVQHT